MSTLEEETKAEALAEEELGIAMTGGQARAAAA